MDWNPPCSYHLQQGSSHGCHGVARAASRVDPQLRRPPLVAVEPVAAKGAGLGDLARDIALVVDETTLMGTYVSIYLAT